ncbi:MAG: hypothetical protein Q8L24_01135 [bacterium]|nr:hypothetical protein [bacterium]
MKKSGVNLIEVGLVLVVIVLFLAMIVVGIHSSQEGQKAQEAFDKEEAEQNNQEYAADQKVDWVILGEGYYDHAEYALTGHQVTVVYFSDSRTVQMKGVIEMKNPKGSNIRILQMRTGAGTLFEKRKDKYNIELLDVGGK